MPDFSNPALIGWLAAWAVAIALVLLGRPRARDGRPASATDVAAETEPRPAELSSGDRFRLGLTKTRESLGRRIRGALGHDLEFDGALEELEQALIESDVGVQTSQRLLEILRALPATERTESGVRAALRGEVRGILGETEATFGPGETPPWICLVVGVNGVGKTTTIGKLAARYREAGRSVLLIAADTFRAAAIEQLSVWAERTGADIVRQDHGSDPSAVVFDGVSAAVARRVDVVLIDTAGRLHTKVNLMEELKKVHRVIDRLCPGAPHQVLLVVDATTGQNAISQARAFAAAVEVTGVALSKLDGSARGGMAVAIRHELGLPLRFVGLGEGASDLQPFDVEAFVEGLLPDTY